MFFPQRERQKKLAEIAPAVRIFPVVFIVMALLYIFPIKTYEPMNLLFLSVQIVIVLVLVYISIFGLEYIRIQLAGSKLGEPILLDYLTMFCSFSLIGAVLFVTGGIDSSFKILFLPTILFYTVRFGLRWGLAGAGVAALILAGANLHAGLVGTELQIEIDIIYVGVFFLTSWLVGTMVDMERAIVDRLSREVIHDELTGLYNHRFLHDVLKRRITETPERHFALLMADLDFFKHYNETQGHQAGDILLVKVAENISATVGDLGTVFRFGSDEFAVIVDNATREQGLPLAEQIRCNIRDSFYHSTVDPFWRYNLTVSLGVVEFPVDANTREELLRKVDETLYKAKVISGNKVETYFSVLEQVEKTIAGREKMLFERMRTFLAIINAKDRYTYGHSERVLIYASIIARVSGLNSERKKNLQYAAYLHDIGKIDIDRSILNNPNHLNEIEWETVKSHPVWGAEMVRQVKVLDPVVPFILHHHEHYNGNGYPYGISGKDIPLEARILCLADGFDAMTVERTYKKAMNLTKAIAEMKRNRTRQFDPNLVDLFVRYLERFDKIEEILTLGAKERFIS